VASTLVIQEEPTWHPENGRLPLIVIQEEPTWHPGPGLLNG